MEEGQRKLFIILRIDKDPSGQTTDTVAARVIGESNAQARLDHLRQSLTTEEVNAGSTYWIKY